MEDENICETDDVNDDRRAKWKNMIKWISCVNIHMLRTKVTFLFWGGLVGTYQVYINPFFLSVGLSASQAGLITGMTFLSSSIAGPLWGMLTDYTGRRKLILVLLCLGSASSILSLPWVASSLVNNLNNSSCDHNYNISNNSRIISDCLPTEQDTIALFRVFLSVMVFGSIFFNTLPNYIEAIVLNVVNESKSKATFGGQRIFGSIGSCIAIYLTGVAVDNYQFAGMSRYSVVVVVYLPFVVILLPMCCYLIGQTSFEGKNKGVTINEGSKVVCLNNKVVEFEDSDIKVTEAEDLDNKLIEAEDLDNKLIEAEDLDHKLIEAEDLDNKLIEAEDLDNKLIEAEDLDNKLIEAEDLDNKLIEAVDMDNKFIEAVDMDNKFIEAVDMDNKFIEAVDMDNKFIEAVDMDNKFIEAVDMDNKFIEAVDMDHKLIEAEDTDNKLIKADDLANKVIETDNVSITKHLYTMFRQFEVSFFMFTVLISGLASNLFIYFSVFLINEQMEISKTKMSMILITSSVSSILMFPFSGRIIRFIGGPFFAISLGLFSYCARYIAMSYITMYWIMVSIQALNCTCFALVWSAMMEHVNAISPRKIKVTMILILQSVHFGISPLLINFVGGTLYETFDGKTLFRFSGILCGVWGVLLIVHAGRKHYRNKQLRNAIIINEDSCMETFIKT